MADLLTRQTARAEHRVDAAAGALDSAGVGLDAAARDESLKVDGCGRVLFVDRFEKAAHHRSATQVGPLASMSGRQGVHHEEDPEAPTRLDPFTLSSRPGSAHTIYLDFDGEHIENTAWNGMVNAGAPFPAEPYDEDGKPGLSEAESAKIWAAWSTTADRYSSFDVNVTTVDPGIEAIERTSPSDDRYGIHVVLTTMNNPVASACGCAGQAYLESIAPSETYSRLQPAFVFTQGEPAPGSDMGSVASHETGHSFGLVHDGHYQDEYYGGWGDDEEHPVDAQWAPIMGTGYGFAQWSNSDYPGATNDQDDLAILASAVPALGDDHPAGDPAVPFDMGQTVTGSITSRSDSDTFAIDLDAGQRYEIRASTLNDGSLVQQLTVTGPGGAVVGTDHGYVSDFEWRPYRSASVRVEVPTNARGGSVRYVATVEGVPANTKSGSRSDYGSLGTYTLSARDVDKPSISVVSGVALTAGVPAGGSVLASAAGGTRDSQDPDRDHYSWFVTGDVPGLRFLSKGNPQKRLFAWGTPEQAGTFALTLAVEAPNGRTNQVDIEVVVHDAAPSTPMAFTTGTNIQAYRSLRSRNLLRIEGGVAPYDWAWNGSLPRGLGLILGHSHQVVLTGRPREAGRFVFTASVTDSVGQTVNRTFMVKVR